MNETFQIICLIPICTVLILIALAAIWLVIADIKNSILKKEKEEEDDSFGILDSVCAVIQMAGMIKVMQDEIRPEVEKYLEEQGENK